MAHLARLMTLLESPPPGQGEQLTPYGRLQPPLGFERYKAVQVVAALLRTEHPSAAAGKPCSRPSCLPSLRGHSTLPKGCAGFHRCACAPHCLYACAVQPAVFSLKRGILRRHCRVRRSGAVPGPVPAVPLPQYAAPSGVGGGGGLAPAAPVSRPHLQPVYLVPGVGGNRCLQD